MVVIVVKKYMLKASVLPSRLQQAGQTTSCCHTQCGTLGKQKHDPNMTQTCPQPCRRV